MKNMEIWDKLSKTDKAHTKEFKRAGGFSGTAIKPMYAIQKMTEAFGACGVGWGYTKPEYQIIDGTDGQKLVYCTVGLWHSERKQDAFGVPEYIWGVGGDFVIVKQSNGLRSDDEAFKKAFTDALMNAMKHIGMSADVHMGQFDASKYAHQEQRQPVQTVKKVDHQAPSVPKPTKSERKSMDDEAFDNYRISLGSAPDLDSLKKIFNLAFSEANACGDEPAKQGLMKIKDLRKQELLNAVQLENA